MCRKAGPDALPLITKASNGIRDSSSATGPDERESPTNPVRGDLHATAIFEDPGTPAPRNGPRVKMSGFSEDRGSTPGGQCL